MFSFDPTFITSIASNLIQMINECDENYFPKVRILSFFLVLFDYCIDYLILKYLLFRNLGLCLVMNESSINKSTVTKEKNKQDLQLLNDVWKIVTKFTDPAVNLKPNYI